MIAEFNKEFYTVMPRTANLEILEVAAKFNVDTLTAVRMYAKMVDAVEKARNA